MTAPPPSTSSKEGNNAGDASALAERLKAVIKQRGPLSVRDFMADALYHPQDGYYMSAAAHGRKSPLGADGDFTTAPEISQIFGEILGLWLVQSWLDMGSPRPFNLVELGPGRGTLMNDILRAARLRPEFVDAAQIWLVETSGRLRHEQQKRLKPHNDARIKWVDRFTDVPGAPTLLVANEFFDCLPIAQYVWQQTGWHERVVGLDWDSEDFCFDMAPAPSLDRTLLAHPLGVTPTPDPSTATVITPLAATTPPVAGDILEIGEEGQKLAATIAQFLTTHSGRALIIDYGPAVSGYGESLQAVRDHEFWPPLSDPGQADLTAHVDFQRLGAAALHEGAAFYGPQPQGRFLDRLGLALRVEALCRARLEAEADTIRQGAYRLSSPAQMGELFKVICLLSPALAPPAGFESALAP
ncbi:MAG: SAM-dependent methyltransferase [Pseudomonadota bacterium]